MEYLEKDIERVIAIEQPAKSAQWLGLISAFLAKVFGSLPVFFIIAISLIILSLEFQNVIMKIGGSYNPFSNSSLLWYDVYSAGVYLLLPALAAKYLFKVQLTDLGCKVPARLGLALIFTIIALVILIPYICMFAQKANFRQFYSVHDSSFTKLLFVNLVIFPPYYGVEEFFYRGFLFLYLWKKVKWHSFWITDILFTFSHWGKPGLEILLCIPASVVFNCLTLATRSIYPAILVHFTLGTVLFLIVNLNLLQ